MNQKSNGSGSILQYESKIWETADLLRGCGIKESEWPSYMMPFFALVMLESRLLRMHDELRQEHGEDKLTNILKEDLVAMIYDRGQGYSAFIFEQNKTLKDICQNDKSFEIDFDTYLNGFDGETKDLLGVDAVEGEEYLNIKGIIAKLKAKKILFHYTKVWSEIDLKPFNNSEITTLEEHIKRKWADISAETAGEQYTPDDVIALIAEIIALKIGKNKKLLKLYDCTCGGGNLLFGVEDRIKELFSVITQTYGQDWNDALYALAKIESRFREDSHIEHGNTLTDDKFYNDFFDIVIANPPYGVSWKGYQKDISNDKTRRFHYLPSVSDGQLLFMQHLISKMDADGIGVVVHNGSTLFSGDAGSGESNIRKWMLDSDLVESIIQLPTDEFFNTGIHTYLWILNKCKDADRHNKVMLINAAEMYKQLKKSKGSKRKEVDEESRAAIVATLSSFADNEYARVFKKEYFYFNKQSVQLTNVDENGRYFGQDLEKDDRYELLKPISIMRNGVEIITNHIIDKHVNTGYESILDFYETELKPLIATIDYQEQDLVVKTADAKFWYDKEKETIIKESKGVVTELGCGCIKVKADYKKSTPKQNEFITIKVELLPDYEKDYEIIPYCSDDKENQKNIEDFLQKYISRPCELVDNVVGVEVNFNKVFYSPEKLSAITQIISEIKNVDNEIAALEKELNFDRY